MFKFLTSCLLLIPCQAALANESETILLWTDKAPGALGEEPDDRPRLTIYPAEKPNESKAAVVVCPGGGYQHLAMGHEGKEIADWLNSLGITACVLQYRLAPRYHHPAPITDAQ